MIFFDSIKVKSSTVLGSIPKELEVSGGLTKREFFAALALCGIISRDTGNLPHTHFANLAADIADCLIARLQKDEK
jgi:hypothetical protein